IDWHRRMAESSDYVLPRGAVLEEVLSGLVARVRRMPPGDGYAAMFAAPCGDRYGLHLPLWCADRSHAARIAQLSAGRDLRQRARLQGLIRECIARVGQREGCGVSGWDDPAPQLPPGWARRSGRSEQGARARAGGARG